MPVLRVDVPRKGNVDRNVPIHYTRLDRIQTFPARGTWIEMSRRCAARVLPLSTFPARGTWIEITLALLQPAKPLDVPRKGNVDRNINSSEENKYDFATFPARGTWIEIGF